MSVKGETRMQRFASSEELWKWIDAHEKQLGIGRPYLDRDPPHVGPIDGKEYVDKRLGGKARQAKSDTAGPRPKPETRRTDDSRGVSASPSARKVLVHAN